MYRVALVLSIVVAVVYCSALKEKSSLKKMSSGSLKGHLNTFKFKRGPSAPHKGSFHYVESTSCGLTLGNRGVDLKKVTDYVTVAFLVSGDEETLDESVQYLESIDCFTPRESELFKTKLLLAYRQLVSDENINENSELMDILLSALTERK